MNNLRFAASRKPEKLEHRGGIARFRTVADTQVNGFASVRADFFSQLESIRPTPAAGVGPVNAYFRMILVQKSNQLAHDEENAVHAGLADNKDSLNFHERSSE